MFESKHAANGKIALFVVESCGVAGAFSGSIENETPEELHRVFETLSDGQFGVEELYDIFIIDGEMKSIGTGVLEPYRELDEWEMEKNDG